MPPLRTLFGGLIGAAVLGGLVWTMATTDGPWDRSSKGQGGSGRPRPELAIRTGLDRREIPTPTWIAKSVEIGVRPDQRREGLTINHRVLELRSVSRPERVLPTSAVLVYSSAPELDARIDDVLDGAVPLNPGSPGLFAIGRLAEVRLVRLTSTGQVGSIDDVRVSFVSLTREPRPDER